MQYQNSHITLALVGHCETGKTTIAGHLLWKYGEIDKRTLQKFEEQMQERPRRKYFWFMVPRRFHRKTREYYVHAELSPQKIQTDKHIFTIIDTPGHRDFKKQAIRGISQADAVLLVVSAATCEFEAGMSLEGQTREYILLAYALSGKKLIVCINKMDDRGVAWSQSRFERIKKDISIYLQKVGFNPENIPFIPMSSELGDNVLTKSDNLPWYNGPTLLDTLNNIPLPKRSLDKPLRIPVLDVYQISGIGTVCVGKIAAGTLKSNEYVCLAPLDTQTIAKSVEMYYKPIEQAFAGDYIGINVKNIPASDIKKGYIIGDSSNPPKEVSSFCARIVIIHHPGQIKVGYSPVMQVHTARVPCKFGEIKAIVDKKTGNVIESDPKTLKSGDHALVTLIPLKPLCVETYEEYPCLGKFVILDNRQIVAAGRIESVEKKISEIKIIYS